MDGVRQPLPTDSRQVPTESMDPAANQPTRTTASPGRRPPYRFRAAAIALCVLATAVTLLSLEGILRARGNGPWNPNPVAVRIVPGGSLSEPDLVLGYRHRSGIFEVEHEGLHFTLNHDAETLRVTRPSRPDGRTDCPPQTPQVWILGGSFTHGWAVNDSQSFPWLIQERFPQTCVRNFGVSGYGTVHSLLQIERELKAGRRPRLVVLAYASFHDQCNVFSRERRKGVVPWNHLGAWKHPQARLNADGDLEVSMVDVSYRELPGMRTSVLLHFLEIVWNRLQARWLNEDGVTLALFERIVAIGAEENFDVVVAGLSDDVATQRMLARARERGWTAVDISHDINAPALSHLPIDGHPNAEGQRQYAERLQVHLEPLLD